MASEYFGADLIRPPNATYQLYRVVVAFTSPDAMGFGNRQNKYFSVADFTGLCPFNNGLNGLINLTVGQHDFDFDFRQEIHGVFAAAIYFGVTFLASETLDLGNGHAVDAEFTQSIFDFFELERFDNGLNFFIFLNVYSL